MQKIKIVALITLVLSLFVVSGCSYRNVQGDPNYVELYPEINSGWYVNTERPLFVYNDTVIIPAIEDPRLVGDWLVAGENKDVVLTFSVDNLIYMEGQLMGEWYWGSSDTVIAILYGENGFNEPSISALTFTFLDGTDDFAQFDEYDSRGVSTSFLGVHVD